MHLKITSENIKCDKIYSKNHLDIFYYQCPGFMLFALDMENPFINYLILSNKITKKVASCNGAKKNDSLILSLEVVTFKIQNEENFG